MVKCLLVTALVAIGMTVGTGAAQACGAGVQAGTANEAHATFANISISMWEDTPAQVCGDGVTQPAPYRRLLIKVDGVIVCDRSDVDPSFDPFFFGAGLSSVNPVDSCGTKITMSAIDRPLVPTVPTVSGTRAKAQMQRSTPAEGGVWYTDGGGNRVKLIEQVDANAYTLRGAFISAV